MTGSGALPESARTELLRLSRAALEAHFRGERPPRLGSDRAATFGEARGLFVTLKREGRLRGCIGTLAPTGDLTRAVTEYALRAAFEDPRFAPLEAAELEGCTIEISVLGAPREIGGPEDIEIGADGLILETSGHRGLLLPQVAAEWGFTPERFLAEVSRKAGLPEEAWRGPETRVWAFRAEVFSE